MALPVVRSTKVAAILPQSRNLSALTETAAGHKSDGVGGARIDFHKRDQAFAVLAAGIVDSELGQTQHGEANTQHLTGAEMAVGLGGVAQVVVKRMHAKAVVSSQLQSHKFIRAEGEEYEI